MRHATAWMLAILLTACGGGSPAPAALPTIAGQATVGTEGGSLQAGPVRLDLPARALAAPVTLAVAEGDTGAPPLPPLPAGLRPLGPAWTFSPSGTTFGAPAVFSVELPDLPAGDGVLVLQTNGTHTGWQQLPATVVNGVVSAPLSHFSTVRLLTYCQSAECLVGPPEIAMPPAGGSVDEGGYVLLSVDAIGLTPFTYQWQRDGVALPGQTSQALVIHPAMLADDGMRLSVVVSDRLGRSTTSPAATVAVRPVAPTVASQPDDVQAVAGGSAVFLAGTHSGLAQTLQWERSDDGGNRWAAVPPPSDRARLELAVVQPADDGALFRLVASNAAGSVRTRAARLAVQAAPVAPVIHTAPVDQSTVPGRGVEFSVGASGGGLVTTWERSRDGQTWEAVGSDPQLTLSNADPSDDGALFRATVRNAAGSATSGAARLSVARVPGAAPVRLAAGRFHALALAADGTVFAWGENDNGQLGLGHAEPVFVPTRIPGLSGVATVSAGVAHSLALLGDGRVRAWGWNGWGQVRPGLEANVSAPVAVDDTLSGRGVVAGRTFSLLLRTAGSAQPTWTWGGDTLLDGRQRVGLPGYIWSTPPADPYGLALDGPPVQRAAVGLNHALLVRSDGSLYAWGWDDYGQLGSLYSFGGSFTPVPVTGIREVVQAAVGDNHSVALDLYGQVWVWGWNDRLMLGVPSVTDRVVHAPIRVPLPGPAVEVAAGYDFTLVLLADGRVYGWGRNSVGQLGLGTLDSLVVTPQPVQLPSQLRCVAIAAGAAFGLALDAQGDVWTWGEGVVTGNYAWHPTPVRVPGINLD